ncbi:MAG: hypothetical protein RMA76_09270 [Deltaproteobacteria bacterium]
MPSVMHEALIDLFRQRTRLAPELLEEALGVALPAYDDVRTEDATLTQIVPTEYHADLVVLLMDGTPVHGIVVEVQLRRDGNKKYSWPLYLTALRAKIRCEVSVLVVTPHERVAAWAAEPIALGPQGTFTPWVLGPGVVPRIEDPVRAERAPELAVLSAIAHGQAPGSIDVVTTALTAVSTLDDARAALYADLVMASLGEAVAKELQAMVATGKYEYQSEFAKKYFAEGAAEGEAQGRAAMLLRVLERRGLAVSDEQRTAIESCHDAVRLELWLDRALEATSTDDVLSDV